MLIPKFIKKYRLLFILFCLSAIGIILMIYPLSSIPEVFEYGSEIGNVVYDLSIGYIVSYLFFYLVVFLKEEHDRKHILERVSFQSSLLILNGYSMFENIFPNAANCGISFPASIDQVKKACENIDPFISPVRLNGSHDTTWQWLLQSHRQDNLASIDKIKSLPYIESELLGVLTKIEDCGLHFIAVRLLFPQHRVEHFKDGSFMEKQLYDYFILIEKLEKYADKNFKQFPEHVSMRTERKKLYMGIWE